MWSLILRVIAVGGAIFLIFLAVMAIRRMALGVTGKSVPAGPLEDLRRLHERGLISQEEFERGRRRILGLPDKKDEPATGSEGPT